MKNNWSEVDTPFLDYFEVDITPAVPDISSRPFFRGYEGIGFRKLFGAIA